MSVTTHQSGAMCPSCGRFVGTLDKCPYCGAEVQKRLPMRYVRLACLILGLLGVVILVYAARGAQTPLIKIGNIGAPMNYAYVQLTGTVTRGPIYDADAQSLRFYVADDTGEIQVNTFRDVTLQLIQSEHVPAIGDKITMEGALRIRDEFASVNLASADKLQLERPTVSEIRLADVGYDDEFHYVKVRGDVRDIRQPYQGLTLVTLGDATGELDMAVNSDVEKLYGALPAFNFGDGVEVQGVVSYYRDTPQLVLRHPRDFKQLDENEPVVTTVKLGELATRINQRVRVSGEIMRVAKFSQGLRATVNDDTGEVALVLWQDVLNQMANASQLVTGAQVQALGKVSEFRGELEVLPNRASDIQILAPPVAQNIATPQANVPAPTASRAVTPTAVAVARSVGTLTEDDKDSLVIVKGIISRADTFSKGMRYTVDDGTGTVIVLGWSDVLEDVPFRDALVEGATLRVTGKVNVFNDELEVVPARANDMELIEVSHLVPPTPRAIASLSSDDLDKQVLIKGTVQEISDFSAGKYVTLQDDSGEIQVTLFSNVYRRVQNKLAVGGTVTVRGKVNLFRGKLEVVADEVLF
ncbi:MAG TPA: exodeoxyribonuclease VII large subunit [Anaerolineae bacterium]|nr:exodeoxyribonuclease VII large subunit [Anaerolineae bacterium]